MNKKMIAMILAGGQGSRLKLLTKHVAKPAVPFGGKYRIIDFPLSNCINSGIDTVGVVVQYKPFILNRYIGIGSSWDLDIDDGGVSILPPYATENETCWYKGTADAIFQNFEFLNMYSPEYVLILSGDHIYKMDYNKMLQHHINTEAQGTVAVIDVDISEASRFGIMNTLSSGEIFEFEEKPNNPKNTLASMGIYIFNWSTLKKVLKEDNLDSTSSKDFGKNIIPKMIKEKYKLMTYKFSGYWKDVGTIDSLWSANMDLLNNKNQMNLFDKNWRIYSQPTNKPGHIIEGNANIKNSIISEGCIIRGEVINSVLFSGVIVEEGASVKNSVLLDKSIIEKDAQIDRIIVGEKTIIKKSKIIKSSNEILLIKEEDN
ncbi:glucose-1-phosphate adenylyltransferase [uncultured Cetobacterium sp.]|uniref:glucose-1-phosphate adenylyltransferase n=1 Tax=uncultured Cetobacterium sp. TaxID=527638 RepID=UPI00263089E7|nr:glucose-1-phosphate adenylyltransferase [uncultured Cetobacterium sp.]